MHLVLGAGGAFGGAVVRELLRRGERVRVLTRTVRPMPAGVECVVGDGTSVQALLDACKGCETIFHGINVPYPVWETSLVRITDNVVEAAGLTGATLVFPSTVFGLKPIYEVPLPYNAPLADHLDHGPRKGYLRNQMEAMIEQHAVQRNVRAIVLRCGDFIGPGADGPLVGPMRRAARAGAPVPWFGTLQVGHEFTGVGDAAAVAVGMLTVANRPVFEVVNVAGHHFPNAQAWADALGTITGKPLTPTVNAGWWIRLRGIIDPESREFAELLYLWEGALRLDDARTRQFLPAYTPEPLPDVLRAWLS